jgi:hypothetical protein
MNNYRMCDGPSCRKTKRLNTVEDKVYCNYHLRHPNKIRERSHNTNSKFSLYNRKGRPVCHAFGCTTWRNLQNIFGGLFCRKHCPEIAAIREKIKPHTGNYNEYQARLEEFRFRKTLEQGHAYYMRELEKNIIMTSFISSWFRVHFIE